MGTNTFDGCLTESGGTTLNRPASHELTLRDLTQAFARRRAVFFWALGVCLFLAAVVCVVSTKQYEAKSTIELQSPMGDGLDRQSLMGDAPASSDPLAADITMQTQAKILQSDTLALRTIAALSPADQRNLLPKPHVWSLSRWRKKPVAQDPDRLMLARLQAFRGDLSVKPIGGTHLLQISYLNGNPQTAAVVVNTLIQQLVTFGEETRSHATGEAAQALSKELEGLRNRSEEMQKKVAAMQSKTGLYDEGTTDAQGRAQAYSAILEQFQRAATTLSDATQNRILKEAISHVASTGDAELISSLAGNTGGGAAASSVTNSLGTIQSLRVNESQMQDQLDQLRVKFGPGYPKVAELQAGIAGIEQSIKDETTRIKERANNDSAVADRTWADAQQNYDNLKAQADALNSKTIDYRMSQQEADDSRTLYTDLMKRLNEAGILQGLRSNTIGIVDVARAPRLPSKPAIPLYLAMAVALGLFAGALGVGIAELMDDTVTEFSTVEEMGFRLGGMVPLQIAGSNGVMSDSSMARYNDAIRSVRANLARSSGVNEATVVVVSPVTPERSARQLAASLSGSASRAGHRVLLVEANLREADKVGKGPKKDVLNKLAEPKDTENPKQNLPSVYLLAPGATDQDTPPMLESGQMHELMKEWRSKFDLIVIDAPGVLFQPEALMLSKEADVSLQVVTYGVTTKTSLLRTRELLRDACARQVSVVIDEVPVKSIAYRNYYGSTGARLYTEKLSA
jgi:succinoglycan biosynthesis transport protein ExoP